MTTRIYCLACLCLFLSVQALGQEAEMPDSKTTQSSNLVISGGLAFFPNDAGTSEFFKVSFNHCFRPVLRKNRKLIIGVDWIRFLPRFDPWINIPPIIIVPNSPEPDPGPWIDFKLGELELGTSSTFTPKIGMDFPLNDRINFSVFAGGGFQFTKGNTTNIQELGNFRTTDTTHPVVTYGAAAQFQFTNSLFIKAEFASLSTFENNMSVIGPDDSIATFEGGNMQIPMVNAGIGFSF